MADINPATDIRILTEPAVYLVGRQSVSDAELDRFLADHGVSWQTDTEVAGEQLTETAGRVCYMSFARPRPGEQGLPGPHQGSGPWQRPGTRSVEFRLHRHQPQLDA